MYRMTTIKKLEKELCVSRVSLYALLKKDAFSCHVFRDENNIIMLDDTGVALLKDYYAGKMRGGPPSKNNARPRINTYAPGAAEFNSVITALQEQLAKKDEQIESLLGIVSSK